MSQRKRISWKTKCAAALLSGGWGGFSYDEAKQLTEDQYLSLFHWDHNMLHSSGAKDRDIFWNLTPMFIKAHREKTKTDAKVIAKSRRLRAKYMPTEASMLEEPTTAEQFSQRWADFVRGTKPKRKISSRGFDRSLRKKWDGTVVKRKG